MRTTPRRRGTGSIEPEEMLTVLTQNIWGGAPLWRSRRKVLARGFAKTRPDLIGLQEVHTPDPGGAESQAHELARLAGGYGVIFAAGRISPSGRAEGVAILSRHPVIDSESSLLSQDESDVRDRFGPRVALRAFIEAPEGRVDVIVTHLSLSRRARARTVPELLDFVARGRARSRSRGALLMGDFNAEPDDPSLAVLKGGAGHPEGGWLDAWASSHPPRARGGTWPAIAPFRRIDYLFVQPGDGWTIPGCWREAVTGSDHLGVAARLGQDGSA